MKTEIISIAVSLALSIICCGAFVRAMKKKRVGQPILGYVEEHKSKQGTPTMGGLAFIIPVTAVFLCINGVSGKVAFVSAMIGLGYLCVGFLDDYLKLRNKKNEGLRPYQKIIFQTLISLFAGAYACVNGLTYFFIPFTKSGVQLGWWAFPIISLAFVAITNSVNLTDGLDGLAGMTSLTYLASFAFIITLQRNVFPALSLPESEYRSVISLICCLCGGLCGFLLYNVNRAQLFMGDTGSLSLGGFIGAISIFTSDSFFIPIVGIMFVTSSISVIIQVMHYKRTKKRVFLMAPFHHHLQMKGHGETQIAVGYSLITLVFGLFSAFAYL